MDELVALSRFLGEPARGFAILAEGNTSIKLGTNFWVKASGASLENCTAQHFVQCRQQPFLDALHGELSDLGVQDLLKNSLAGSQVEGEVPSVEAFMHAWLLNLPGIECVGHVHPISNLSILCHPNSKKLATMRFFPDEVVCCGVASAWVPYVDPGLKLAQAIRDSLSTFHNEFGHFPKIINLQSHGIIAIGSSTAQVKSALLMAQKVATVISMAGGISAVLSGSFQPLPTAEVERIASRKDEHYRQQQLWKEKGNS